MGWGNGDGGGDGNGSESESDTVERGQPPLKTRNATTILNRSYYINLCDRIGAIWL